MFIFKKVSTLIGIIIIVAIAVIAFGGVFTYQYFVVKNNQTTRCETMGCLPGVQTGPTVADQIAGWKTYTNSQYGFEIKYPNNLALSLDGPNVAQKDLDAGKIISGTITPTYETVNFRDPSGIKKFEISIFHKTDKELTKENYNNFLYTSGLCDLRYLYPKEEVVVNTLATNGVQIINTKFVDSNVPGGSRSCYYLKNIDNNLIVISLLAPDSQSDYEATNKIVQVMLSTFAFTTPDQTAGWKTYTDEYGFQMSYPDDKEIKTPRSIIVPCDDNDNPYEGRRKPKNETINGVNYSVHKSVDCSATCLSTLVYVVVNNGICYGLDLEYIINSCVASYGDTNYKACLAREQVKEDLFKKSLSTIKFTK